VNNVGLYNNYISLYEYSAYVVNKLLIVTPHRSTMYVDAVYCYRPSSVVCRCVGLSVTLVSPAKTAEPIKLPFGLRIRVGPGNRVLDGCPHPPWEGAILRGEWGVPL